MGRLPLEGIRVIDISMLIAGPHVGQWLAVLGAEVIKVETGMYIDWMRTAPAGLAERGNDPNRNGLFHNLNYGKKSVTLNLKSARGRELCYELIKRSNIVLEGYPVAQAEKLGLSYDKIKAVNRDAIVISVSLLGKTGLEQSRWFGFGPLASGFVGQMDAQGYPGGAPRQTGGTWPDYAIGSAVAFHALAALYHQRKPGAAGQWIDASMAETVLGEMPEWYMDFFMNGRDRRQWANNDDIMAPHNTYPCRGEDNWIAIAVGNAEEWNALCGVMRDPQWSRAPIFADQFSRWKNREKLDTHIGEWTRDYDHLQLAETLQKAGVPAGAVLNSVEIHQDRHLWEWGYWWTLDHHEVGKRIEPGVPAKLSNVPRLNYSSPPDLGAHNIEVFGGLVGLSLEEIRQLIEEKVIY